MLVFLSVIENTVVLCLCARSFTHNSKKSSRAEKNFHNARSLLSSYNRAGDLYGRILTEVVSTDRTHVHTTKVKTDLARLISCLFYGKNKNNSVRLCNWFVLTDILLPNGDEPNFILPNFARPLYFFSQQLFATYRNQYC